MNDDARVSAATRRAALASEVKDRERDGWAVVERTQFDVWMLHEMRPPWWQIAVTLFFAVFGGLAVASAERHLRIEAHEDGQLVRTTTGDIPSHWPRRRLWEVSDGPAAAPVTD